MRMLLRTLSIRIAFLAMGVLIFGGCTPEKAKSIRLADEQFRNHALIAVHAVEKAMKAELAPRPRSTQAQTDAFVAFLSELDLERLREADQEIGFSTLEQAANPDAIELDPAYKEALDGYLKDLRTRYITFAGALQGLEEGSFFSSAAMERSIQIINRLTADMAGIAKHFTIHPPQLIQHRGSLVADTLDILEDENLSQTSKNDRLVMIKVRFDEIKTAEQDLLLSVVVPSLKAAEMGRVLQEMAADYDKLTVSDMQDLLLRSIRIVGDLTGRDMHSLTTKADAVFAQISADPVLKTVADQAMSEIRKATAR